MTLMTNDLNYFNCPYSPHDQTTSWPFHYLSFTKVAKRFQLCKFSSKKLRIRPSSFLWHKVVCINSTGGYGRLQRFRKMLFANRVFYECYSRAAFSMNAIREPRFLWMLFASRVFYECYSRAMFSMNVIRELRFLWMLFASRVFYGSVRNSGDSLMTVVFMSSAKGVAICDGVLSSSSTCL